MLPGLYTVLMASHPPACIICSVTLDHSAPQLNPPQELEPCSLKYSRAGPIRMLLGLEVALVMLPCRAFLKILSVQHHQHMHR